jgi:hypothetical protein
MLSRDWFVIWMTALSFLVAIGYQAPHEAGMPDWFSALVEAGIPHIWVVGVSTSIISTFLPTVPCVSLFVDLVDADKTQPFVTWFYEHHVPVWYPWGTKEARAAEHNSVVASYTPTPHQLQEAKTFHTKQPSQPEPRTNHTYPTACPQEATTFHTPQPSQPEPQAKPKTTACQTWKEFFAEHTKSNA